MNRAAKLRSHLQLSADNSRAQILRAAETLFAERGLHSVSMQDIADAAGVSRATVFNRFGSKQLVLDAITARSLEAYRHLLQAALADERTPTPELLEALFRKMGKGIEINKSLYREVFAEIRKVSMGLEAEGLSPDLRTQTYRLLTDLFRRGQERGEIAAGHSAGALATAFDSLLSGAVIQWLHEGERSGLAGLLTSLINIFLQGAVARRS